MRVQAIDTAVKPVRDFNSGQSRVARYLRCQDRSRFDAGESFCGRRHAPIVDYILAAKPGIVIANSISVVGAFLMAAKGDIDTGLLLATMLGVSLVIASGCVLNNYIDRDVDCKMTRTRSRVLAQGLISPRIAVIYALFLGMAGMAVLLTTTNPLCTAIVLVGWSIYVGAYSLGLKRRFVYAVLIGSLAGAAPPLAGYCAVTARFDTGALILLIIFSVWQIPHAYAIAVYSRDDFAAAGLPVLTVKRGVATAKKHILISIGIFLPAAMMPTLCGYTSQRFLIAAAAMGLAWLGMAWQGLRTTDDRRWAKRMIIFSIVTITVLSVMMGVDFTSADAMSLLSAVSP